MTDSASEMVGRLRGRLHNCLNHLERAKRHWHRGDYDECIEFANRCLYETLHNDTIDRLQARLEAAERSLKQIRETVDCFREDAASVSGASYKERHYAEAYAIVLCTIDKAIAQEGG